MSEPHRPYDFQVGVALGGGGARGMAHVGVLKALDREGIPIDMLAGTSMGGIVGAMYSAGVSFEAMEEAIKRLGSRREFARLVDIRLTQGGLIKGERVQNMLAELIGEDTTFEQLAIPLTMVSVDLYTGREVELQQGPVIDAVRATISIPGVFEPVDAAPYRLVDGGVLNNVPADVVQRMGADFIIAVDVLPDYRRNQPGLAPEVEPVVPKGLPKHIGEVYNVVIMMISTMTAARLAEINPAVVIRPDLPNDVGLLIGFERAPEIIALGEAAAVAAMPHIKSSLEQRARRHRPFPSLFSGRRRHNP